MKPIGLMRLAAGLAVSTAALVGTVSVASARTPEAAQPARQTADLSDGWKFRFGTQADSVTASDFDDSGWQEVSVPHTWNNIGSYGETRSAGSDNRQGTGWYRLHFAAPAAAKGERQILDFAAVSKIADVWVNGVHIGQHKGAFARFRFDVTDVWKPGADNLIVVQADNSKATEDSATGQIIPLAGDFFVFGGIYRGVSLITTGEVGIDLLDHAGPGIYVKTDDVSTEGENATARITVTVRLRNSGTKTRTVRPRISIEGGPTTVIKGVKLRPGQTAEQAVPLTIQNARLWNGTADPHLYKVDVAVLDEKGRSLDSAAQTFGIRTFRFDADKGFFLNGKHVKLHGVSRHQDREGKGWALSAEDHAQDMALVAEIGANTVREAHYQHADAWTDEADKAGMVVWAELPYVGTPSLTGGKGSPELWANAEEQLRELIRQNYNHPSIMMWSVGNEVDSAKAFGAMKEVPQPIELLRHLNAVAKQEDPTRPTTFADFSEDMGPFAKTRQPLTDVTDFVGYNRYPGWYYMQGPMAGKVLGGMMDKLHALHPEKPVSISEYGAGGAISQHSDDPASGYVSMAGRPQPEEYQAWAQELLWPAIAQRDYIFASWVWNMFDFPSDLRAEGDSVDLNTKGLVTFDRKTKKDAFYYYQAAWTQAPMIHLTGKRYAARSYPVMDVKAYTNAGKARLTMNGADLGEIACPNFTCVWQGVALRPGANEAKVTALAEGGAVTDEATWDGIDPAVNGIRIDSGSLGTSVIDGMRYGSDTFVTGGRPVPRDAGSIGGMRQGPPLQVTALRPGLFDYWREGNAFTYAVPVPDGKWMVTLRLLDGRPTPSHAAVTVKANGKTVLDSLDVAKAAGGSLRELQRSFPVTVSGGMLKLDFSAAGGVASLAAIEITK